MLPNVLRQLVLETGAAEIMAEEEVEYRSASILLPRWHTGFTGERLASGAILHDVPLYNAMTCLRACPYISVSQSLQL